MLRLVVLSVAVAVAALPAAPSAAQSALYPTDACVASKLDAAAAYCAKAILFAGSSGGPIAQARQTLTSAWASAEATSTEAGVSCTDSTASADEMIAAIDGAAASLASELASSGDPKGCATSRQQLAGQVCQLLLGQEATHLRTRSEDRTRAKLAAAQELIESKISPRLGNGASCPNSPDADALFSLADGVAEEARMGAFVSPRVSSEWTMITPDAQVPYNGKTLEPICSRGTPWVFFVKRGTVNKTLMYYQGGGACWSHTTCTFPTHKQTTGAFDNPAGASTGFADLNNPENPFKDWNAVFVPYCTGDVHWGDAVVEHRQGGARVTIHHKGYVNAQVAEKWAREHFANPDQVFVTGSSAGAYGAIVNSLPLQEFVWPSSDFAVLGDGGNGVITEDFLHNDLAKWGIEQNLPDWIPGLDVPLTELDASKLWSIPAEFYPHNRFANYATAFDGGQGGQVGFYNVMLNLNNPFSWLRWWPPSCEWNAIMHEYVLAAAATAPNYRYYIGSGSRHTMWGHDKVYTDITGNVPTIVHWVNAMLEENSPEWVNVETEDPGLLLEGDPRPNPLEPPYYGPPDAAEERVSCD